LPLSTASTPKAKTLAPTPGYTKAILETKTYLLTNSDDEIIWPQNADGTEFIDDVAKWVMRHNRNTVQFNLCFGHGRDLSYMSVRAVVRMGTKRALAMSYVAQQQAQGNLPMQDHCFVRDIQYKQALYKITIHFLALDVRQMSVNPNFPLGTMGET